jgi:hypothetical protein
MADNDAFTLQRSTLNPFLFAELGTEANGAVLTMLSVLARLDRDPWAEAARLVDLPMPAKIDQVAAAIGKMPLRAADLSAARAIAERLVLLLPNQVDKSGHSATANLSLNMSPRSRTVLILCCALAFGTIANVIFVQDQHASQADAPAAARGDGPVKAPISE